MRIDDCKLDKTESAEELGKLSLLSLRLKLPVDLHTPQTPSLLFDSSQADPEEFPEILLFAKAKLSMDDDAELSQNSPTEWILRLQSDILWLTLIDQELITSHTIDTASDCYKYF